MEGLTQEALKDLKAISEFIEYELSDYFNCAFEFYEIDHPWFYVTFPNRQEFHDFQIKVVSIDDDEPLYSDFWIERGDTDFGVVSLFNSSIKEFWKALLWANGLG